MKKFTFCVTLLLAGLLSFNVFAGQQTVTKAYSDNVRAADGKISSAISDPRFDIAQNNEPDLHCINKFGQAPAGVETTATDIWDLADGTPTQQIWLAPDAAVTHWIQSSSGSDASGGVGARTVRIYGLIDWDTPEITEDIIMNGNTSVTTSQSYVCIYRLEVLTKGATNVNVGAISAFATDDGTIAARILAGNGSTEMAIYAVSSLDRAYITNYYGTINKAQGAAATLDYSLRINPEPDSELTNFRLIHSLGVQSTGASHFGHHFNPYVRVDGPAILKLQGIGSAGNIDGTGGFGVIRWTNTSGFDALITTRTSTQFPMQILTTHDGRVIRTSQDVPN